MSPSENGNQQFTPICPHCKREPVVLQGVIVRIGIFPMMIVACKDCRKVVSTTALPVPPEALFGPPVEESSIFIPGRNM